MFPDNFQTFMGTQEQNLKKITYTGAKIHQRSHVKVLDQLLLLKCKNI